MVRAGRDSDGAGAKVDRAQPCHLARLIALVVHAVIAELPVGAVAPALDAAAVEDRAGVPVAGRDGDGAGAEVDDAQAGHIVGGRAASRPCEGSQPSVRGAGLLVGRELIGSDSRP